MPNKLAKPITLAITSLMLNFNFDSEFISDIIYNSKTLFSNSNIAL